MPTIEDVLPNQEDRDALLVEMFELAPHLTRPIDRHKWTGLPVYQRLRIPNHGEFIIHEYARGKKIIRRQIKP